MHPSQSCVQLFSRMGMMTEIPIFPVHLDRLELHRSLSAEDMASCLAFTITKQPTCFLLRLLPRQPIGRQSPCTLSVAGGGVPPTPTPIASGSEPGEGLALTAVSKFVQPKHNIVHGSDENAWILSVLNSKMSCRLTRWGGSNLCRRDEANEVGSATPLFLRASPTEVCTGRELHGGLGTALTDAGARLAGRSTACRLWETQQLSEPEARALVSCVCCCLISFIGFLSASHPGKRMGDVCPHR